MDEPRFLPHLAAACRALLGDEDAKNIPPHVRAEVAAKAKVGEATVKRFLAGERIPRNRELDQMVTAVAAVGKADWTDPWHDAVVRARDAKVDWERYLTGDLPIAPTPSSGEPD